MPDIITIPGQTIPGTVPGADTLVIKDTTTDLAGTIVNDSPGTISDVTVVVTVNFVDGTQFDVTVPNAAPSWTYALDQDEDAVSATVIHYTYDVAVPPYSCTGF